MSLFRRAIRFLLLAAGVVAGLVTAVAFFFARRITKPPRVPLWADPLDLGMAYEDVEFAANDGVRLSGWFIPAKGEGKAKGTLIMVHGWPWNRLGERGDDALASILGTSHVDLLRLMHGLHNGGYNLVAYDSRSHGMSADGGPASFGFHEANDILGAIRYLRGREDVDKEKIGIIGFSMGANAVLYALPHATDIKAALCVQPTSPSIFAQRFGRHVLGPLGPMAIPLTDSFVQQFGGLSLRAVDPLFVAPSAGKTPVLFVQGKGDTWGSVDNVQAIAANTPGTVDTLLVDTLDRFGGYQYLIEHPEIALSFFNEFV